MIKIPALLILALISFQTYADIEMEEVRKMFFNAIENEKEAEKLNNLLLEEEPGKPLIEGYLGASFALLARHGWSPLQRWENLNKGLDYLAEAIQKAPKDVEIRFLRFSILYHIPSFLGFNEEKEKDRKEILQVLYKKETQGKPEQVISVILNFFLEKNIGDQEKLLTFKVDPD